MTRRSPDPRRSNVAGRARRAAIEQAAVEVLAESGYAAASVGRIAERAGVSKGVVTHHFTSRDDLMRVVALRLLEECRAHVAAHVDDSVSPMARLRATVAAQLAFFASRRARFAAMAEVLDAHRDAAFGRAFADVSAEETVALAALIEAGVQAREIRAVDAAAVAHYITALTHGVLDRWAADDEADLAQSTGPLLDFISHALAADDARR